MNYSSLPNIVALGLLLLNYRPLMRRAGSHANLWCYGWGFILLHSCNQFFAGAWPLSPWGWRLGVSTGTVLLGGLCFLAGSANRKHKLVSLGLMLSLGAGPLAQAILIACPPVLAQRCLPWSLLLYILPAAYLLVRKQSRNQPVMILAGAYMMFAAGSYPFATVPLAVRCMMLALIFLSASSFAVYTSPQLDRATLTTGFGLLLWAVRYPALFWLHLSHPEITINSALLQIPEFFVLAGSVLLLLEERLAHAERLATHDPLTNLPNRRFLQDRFVEALAEARENRTTIACLIIDVDHFKTINDTRGHGAGDAILKALAVRLAWHLSPRDVLARTGGDEFTAMLAGVSNEHYLRFVAEAMTSAASVPVQVDGEPVDVSISMGIALSPDDADEIDDLLRLADEAMYRSKRRGGNVLCFASDLSEPEQESVYVSSRRAPAGQLLQMAGSPRPGGQRPIMALNAHEL